MFERFKQRYKVISRLQSASSGPIVTNPLEHASGYEEFMQKYAGATFNEGVYRIHTLDGRAKWTRLVAEAFPIYRGQFSVFGCDWLGRQFALDAQRREGGQPLVAMYEPGTGQVLEIPATFEGFHELELIDYSDASLADVAFGDWLRAGNRAPGPTECVGYKLPLFLGGLDGFENFELTDMEVYWDIIAQLLAQTRGLPDGTPIGKITLK